MKPKTIFTIWILATVIGLTGVGLFVTGGDALKTISRLIMDIGIILNAVWFVGLIVFIGKKVFTKA